MALHPHQAIVPGRVSTLTTICEFRIAVAGVISEFRYKTDLAAVGAVSLQFKKNGATIHTMNITAGATNEIDAGLALVVAKGDVITTVVSSLVAFNFFGPRTYIQVDVEDTIPTYLGGTSATSLLIGLGAKVFDTQPGIAIEGARVRLAHSLAPASQFMEGVVTAYGPDGEDIEVTVDYIVGAGTFDSWLISVAGEHGEIGPEGDAGPQGPAGNDGVVQSVVGGTNVTVDNTDPANPVINSTGGGGGGIYDALIAQDAPVGTLVAVNGASLGTRNGLDRVAHTGSGSSKVKGVSEDVPTPGTDFTFEVGIATYVESTGGEYLPFGMYLYDDAGVHINLTWEINNGLIRINKRLNANSSIWASGTLLTSSGMLNLAGNPSGLQYSRIGLVYFRVVKVGAVETWSMSFNGYDWFLSTNLSAEISGEISKCGVAIDEDSGAYGGSGRTTAFTIVHWKMV
jgi:hypothetical protein